MPASPPSRPKDLGLALIDRYFTGPHSRYRLTQHHHQSYSDFVRYKIPAILQDFNSGSNSEVYNTASEQQLGEDDVGAAMATGRGTTEGASSTPAATPAPASDSTYARLHFFVGMEPHDLHEHLRTARTDTLPPPSRLAVRNQVIEYTQVEHQPRRLITPNEARLNNLNYQIDLTATVTAVHHDSMSDAERKRFGVHMETFLAHCLDDWHRRHTAVCHALAAPSKHKTSPSLETFEAHAETHYDAVLRAATHAPRTVSVGTAPLERLGADQMQLWARRARSTQPTLAKAVAYVAQRVAAAVSPHVTLYDDVVLTKMPLMLHSPFCVLRDQPRKALREMGECPYERGGYFVVRGKEKVIISQESYCRNIIQTRISRVTAPPSHVPPSTLVLRRPGDTATPADQEEVFEAHINCTDDPHPPVMVKLQYKRLYQYARGGDRGAGAVAATDDDVLQEMRRHMNFRGLYLTLCNRKGDDILTDVPLFLLFRAMGVTHGSASTETGAGAGDRLSDRDILECILGYDSSGTVETVVPVARLRELCGVDSADALSVHSSCWYTPHGDGDCAWLVCAKPQTWAVGARVQLRTKTTAAGSTVAVEVAEVQPGHRDFKVRRVGAARAPWPSRFIAPPTRVHADGAEAVLAACRYERRHRATVLRKTGSHLVLAYHTHTATARSYDPIVYDLLLPSMAEGSFAPSVEVARDILDRQIHTTALREQVRTLHETEADAGTDRVGLRREAVFHTLFTHLNDGASDGGASDGGALRRKQFYLGYLTKRLLFAFMGLDERETSRDSYRLRRVQTSGEMLAEVFRYEYFQLGNKYREYVAMGMRQQGEEARFQMLLAPSVVRTNLFDEKYMTERLQKSFMGNWGSKVAQDADQKAYCQELIRLSFNGSVAYLRRVHKELPSTSKPGQKKGTSKAVGPRMLHGAQYGMICPLETPDGGNIGKIKHLSTFAFVCPELPPADRRTLLRYVRQLAAPLERLDSFYTLADHHKVLIDGRWAFVCPTRSAGNRHRGSRRGGASPKAEESASPFPNTTPLPPDVFVDTLRLLRRNGLLSPLVSIAWNIARQEIHLSTQEGRVMRPLLTVEHGLLRFADGYHNTADWTWGELLSGRGHDQRPVASNGDTRYFHDLAVRYDAEDGRGWRAKVPRWETQPLADTLRDLRRVAGVMEYLDTLEIDTRLLAMDPAQLPDRQAFFSHALAGAGGPPAGVGFVHPSRHNPQTAYLVRDTAALRRERHRMQDADADADEGNKGGACPGVRQRYAYTHCEIHPALMLGVMAMLTPFSEHSPAPRNQYSCHQSKQALGLYVSSFRKRMDHANHILHHPERPLAGSRFAQHINGERLNYGTNIIVAIMCYSGFNIEDALILNRRSVERGLFQSTYYFTEEVTEKDTPNEKVFIGRNPELLRNTRTNSYALVDAHPHGAGVLPDTFLDQEVQKDDVLIEAYEDKREPGSDARAYTDYKRVASKSGAFVDQIYLSDNARGRRVGKVTLRKVRVPTIGDKFASRSGQKGTVGALLEEEDMPFVAGLDAGADAGASVSAGAAFLQGMRPDLILNVHAFPKRMTLGQMYEMLSSVLGCHSGRLVDATPLCSNRAQAPLGDPTESLAALMGAAGLDPHGNQTMCNGVTGERMAGRVFVGPSYYQRLKQMPEDKYYHRARGREDITTRQPIGGRAQGGALKLGEMERDSVLAHGVASFMKEAWYERSDAFRYTVGEQSGNVEAPHTQDKVDPTRFTPVRAGSDALNDDDEGGFRQYVRNDTSDVRTYHSHGEAVERERVATNVTGTPVNVPFAFRLLSQECEAMGMGVHLGTERSYAQEVGRMEGAGV